MSSFFEQYNLLSYYHESRQTQASSHKRSTQHDQLETSIKNETSQKKLLLIQFATDKYIEHPWHYTNNCVGGNLMENEILKSAPRISDIGMDTHFDFKLEGWPASAVLIAFCLSGVIVYGIKVRSKTELMNAQHVSF